MKKQLCLIILFGFLLASVVFAHQPRFVDEDFTEIKNPEVSQAFYGELDGYPEKFQIKSDKPFTLYVGMLVPYLEGIDKDVSVEINSANEKFSLNGLEHKWTVFYEEYAGDAYYEGPDMKQQVNEGIYDILVFSPDNKGKYVLVVGEKEEFPFNEMIKTIGALPRLKMYFEKSPLTAFVNMVGFFLFITYIMAVGIILVLIWLIRKLIGLKYS
jgi:hypothetical protein